MLAAALLFAFPLALVALLSTITVAVGASIRLRILTDRIRSLERRLEDKAPLSRGEAATQNPLAGLRVALDIEQDHPHPVFATLLKEALHREGAFVDDAAQTVVQGILACNGYADVYYRAEFKVLAGPETLFTLTEKPPHGDRQENLAREVVARLKAEWVKQERQGALRELGD